MTFSPRPSPVRVVSVRRLADYLKRRLEGDSNLRNVSVRGEISNHSFRGSGHCHFDLKEGDAVLRCFAWADDALTFPPLRNGVAIVATGSVSTYAAKSTYQLIVRSVQREGVGDVHALFEERKKRLAADGVFDPARKRMLPRFPFRVALVSSRNAAGALDFVTLLRERAPHVEVVWCDTAVQGPSAPAEIARALGRASRADVDAIVVTRGGGSFEDLFVFSDERVVRAIAQARHPTISAIGHTSDQQLCDFAADLHLETPSAAAEAIGPGLRDLRALLEDSLRRAKRASGGRLERLAARLGNALVRSKLAQPKVFLTPLAQRLDELDSALAKGSREALRAREERVRSLIRRLEVRDPSRRLAERGARLQAAGLKLRPALAARLESARRRAAEATLRLEPAASSVRHRLGQKLALTRAHLDGKNPEAILQRGYAIVTYRDAIVRDPADVREGERVEARLARGTLTARVERKEADGNQRIG